MDASNPVITSDRRTVSQLLRAQLLTRRQDLGYIREMARTAERVILPVGELLTHPLLDRGEVREIAERFRSSIPKVDDSKEDGPLLPNILEILRESYPVSGLLTDQGLPIHPAGKNQAQGATSVSRKMGGSPGAPLGLLDVISVFGEECLERKYIYTAGTWKGFVKRLEQQMGRKTVSVYTAYEKVWGSKPKMSLLIKRLNELFPRDRSDWPSLESNLEESLERIKLTANSSAGAPYWRNKGECIDEIVHDVMPVLVEAIKKGDTGLNDLYHQNPELFLCEVKNKMDRYEISRLEEKTRPYCCVPAHWSCLFSILTQRFQDGLRTFDFDGSSVNAYGFSSAGGGLGRMVDWMLNDIPQRGKYVVYGDDTCLIYKRGGKIYRVDPDFKQMDGSLNADDIELTCQWVYRALMDEDQMDHDHFWATVADWWAMMASNPIMIIDGKTIYRKHQPNGLLSGVPGTTLFDTVKSALSWDLYLDHCSMAGRDPLDEAEAVSFMASCGLVIKPGTWNPVEVKLPVIGELVTDHKFLGIQILCTEYNGNQIFVPTLPEEEALEMILVQKDNPFEKVPSGITRARTLYDRVRGLYITFGFSIPRIAAALHNIVNNLDPAAILMVTQGEPEKPDHITMQDYEYPDSSGFPSVEFCHALYGGLDAMPHWIQIFPTLTKPMEEMRSEDRKYQIRVKAQGNQNIPHQPAVLDIVAEPAEIRPCSHAAFEFLMAASTAHRLNVHVPPAARSHILGGKGDEKYVPNQKQSVRLHLEACRAGTVGALCREFDITKDKLREICVEYGLFATGMKDDDVVAVAPVQTPSATEQAEIATQSIQTADVISPGVEKRLHVKREMSDGKPRHYIRTAPESLFINSGLLSWFDKVKEPTLVKEPIDKLHRMISALKTVKSMRWRQIGFILGEPFPCEVALEVLLSVRRGVENYEEWHPVASCRSTSKHMAKKYVSAAVLYELGYDIEGDPFSVGYAPPPVSYRTWAGEVDAEATVSKGPEVETKWPDYYVKMQYLSGFYYLFPDYMRPYILNVTHWLLQYDTSTPLLGENAYRFLISEYLAYKEADNKELLLEDANKLAKFAAQLSAQAFGVEPPTERPEFEQLEADVIGEELLMSSAAFIPPMVPNVVSKKPPKEKAPKAKKERKREKKDYAEAVKSTPDSLVEEIDLADANGVVEYKDVRAELVDPVSKPVDYKPPPPPEVTQSPPESPPKSQSVPPNAIPSRPRWPYVPPARVGKGKTESHRQGEARAEYERQKKIREEAKAAKIARQEELKREREARVAARKEPPKFDAVNVRKLVREISSAVAQGKELPPVVPGTEHDHLEAMTRFHKSQTATTDYPNVKIKHNWINFGAEGLPIVHAVHDWSHKGGELAGYNGFAGLVEELYDKEHGAGAFKTLAHENRERGDKAFWAVVGKRDVLSYFANSRDVYDKFLDLGLEGPFCLPALGTGKFNRAERELIDTLGQVKEATFEVHIPWNQTMGSSIKGMEYNPPQASEQLPVINVPAGSGPRGTPERRARLNKKNWERRKRQRKEYREIIQTLPPTTRLVTQV